MAQESKSWWDWVFKILSVLVIPALGYVGTLHAQVAVQEEQLKNQGEEIRELKEEVKQIGDNRIALTRLEGEVKAANEKLDDIKVSLDRVVRD